MNRKRINVLLIEDNPGDARLIGDMLAGERDMACSLECADRLSTGVRRVTQGGIDVVLLDLGLPDSSGIETLQSILTCTPQIPAIVILSGLGDEDVAVRAMQGGAQDYLVKGRVESGMLIRAIRYAIERNKVEEALRKSHDELSTVVIALESEIAERKRAEETLRQSEERFRLLVSAVQDYAIIMIDPNGYVMSWNSGAERIYGYSYEEIIGVSSSRFFTPEDLGANTHVQSLEIARNHGSHQDEGWHVRKDGSRFWASSLIAAITDETGRLRGFTKITRDLTERRQAEEALRTLAGRILTAQEVERSRIAREMHDDFTQRLAVLAIEIGKLEKVTALPGGFSNKLRAFKENLIRLSQDVHALSRQIHPSIVEDLGLIDALRSECNNFSQRERIAVQYVPQPIPREISGEVALCLYRIVQEGLRNIAKHAGVGVACVSLTATNDGILLSIEDAGVGFVPVEVQGKPGLGLASMEERVRLIGGDISIHAEPGKGTLIEVWAPLSGVSHEKITNTLSR
jgi:PAS domain S-box-containing protein